ALDRDDLEVVPTHLQDALVKVADVMWRPHEKRLVIALSRFDWLSAEGTKPELRRCRAALRFERVKCCKCRNVNPAGKDAVLNLLAVEFSETDAPAGVVNLIFSGGGALRLPGGLLGAAPSRLWPSRAAALPPRPAGGGAAPPPPPHPPRRRPAGRTGPCRSVSTAAPLISPSVSAPFLPPSARRRPTSRRSCAGSLRTSLRAAIAP